MSATENLIVDCLASNPGSKDFTSYQHVIQLLSECFDHTDGDGDGNDDGDDWFNQNDDGDAGGGVHRALGSKEFTSYQPVIQLLSECWWLIWS